MRENGFFVQKRVGRFGKIFNVYKLKTMSSVCVESLSETVTTSTDVRITKLGKYLRRFKIDELPQLYNVLIGDMSFVGPRPDVPGYADLLTGDDRIVLSVRPGITGPASLKYKNEEYILSEQKNPQAYNDNVIWPDKVNINRDYITNYSFRMDLIYILKTLAS
jgi:lipopolysaccharide/colanic/teichoic acid biosynthesis glycosyltransferase